MTLALPDGIQWGCLEQSEKIMPRSAKNLKAMSGVNNSPPHVAAQPSNTHSHIPPADDVLLTEDELARRWRLASAKKLQADRVKGIGCPFVRIGRCVRYRMSDVLAHEAANLRQSTTGG